MTALRQISFQSRAKDNKSVEGFKIRKKFRLVTEEEFENIEKLKEEFSKFVEDGVTGETCRFYAAFNSVDEEVLKKALIVKLLSDDNVKLTNINSTMISLSMTSKLNTKKWLFDFDSKDEILLKEFIDDLYKFFKHEEIEVRSTPNGFHVITAHGCDTRELLKDRPYIENKRTDGMTIVDIKTNRR